MVLPCHYTQFNTTQHNSTLHSARTQRPCMGSGGSVVLYGVWGQCCFVWGLGAVLFCMGFGGSVVLYEVCSQGGLYGGVLLQVMGSISYRSSEVNWAVCASTRFS